MHITFVLVKPVVPENVGFCARGLKTMGFSDLRIVGEPLHEEQGAKNTAYGSHDLLEEVQSFSMLKEAVADCELVVGTTAKKRLKRYDNLSPEALKTVLSAKPKGLKVALVFGSETNGLSSEDLEHCDLLTTIPLKTAYPSLNLAQAVLVYAYELAKEYEDSTLALPSGGLTQSLKSEAHELLKDLDYDRQPINKQRILDRLMLLGEKDAELVMGGVEAIAKVAGVSTQACDETRSALFRNLAEDAMNG